MNDIALAPAPSKIVSVGTATPPTAYSQEEMLELLGIDDKRIRRLYTSGSIKRRFLTLPAQEVSGLYRAETQSELLKKHREHGVEVGSRALRTCIESVGFELADIRYLCCITTTGWLTPGLSALLCNSLGLSRDCARIDIVGMGCNAGLNGLNAVASWAKSNPGKLAVMLCVEICSAAYITSNDIQTAVVNSLFADGAAAAAVVAGSDSDRVGPTILKFESLIIPNSEDAMRFEWDEAHGKFSFVLGRDVPYLIGSHAEAVVTRLLEGTGVRRSRIDHWIIHSGGKKVIDSLRVNLGLTKEDVRHTMSVLRDFGNLSSGSFLFSYDRLLQEGRVAPGDLGVCMTMGPGATIEAALIRW